jgi:hypothetical protein
MVVSETLINEGATTLNLESSSYPGASEYDTTTGKAWFFDGAYVDQVEPNLAAASSSPATLSPPDAAKFDLEISLMFVRPAFTSPSLGVYTYTASYYRGMFYNLSGSTYVQPRSVDFYNYLTSAWELGFHSMQTAVMRYYANRFSSGRKMYERRYGGLKFSDGSTTSHANIQPMKQIDIDDGIDTVTFYATEVGKDFENDTTRVLWAEA